MHEANRRSVLGVLINAQMVLALIELRRVVVYVDYVDVDLSRGSELGNASIGDSHIKLYRLNFLEIDARLCADEACEIEIKTKLIIKAY